MTLFVGKQIKKFRLAKNLKQSELAAIMGVSCRILSCYEVGTVYPAAKYIAKLNDLGADIHPSYFSPFIQKIVLVFRRRKIKITDPSSNLQLTEDERLWIQMQLERKALRHVDIAKKAGVSRQYVGQVLNGLYRSRRVQCAIADVLGYSSFDELLKAIGGAS